LGLGWGYCITARCPGIPRAAALRNLVALERYYVRNNSGTSVWFSVAMQTSSVDKQRASQDERNLAVSLYLRCMAALGPGCPEEMLRDAPSRWVPCWWLLHLPRGLRCRPVTRDTHAPQLLRHSQRLASRATMATAARASRTIDTRFSRTSHRSFSSMVTHDNGVARSSQYSGPPSLFLAAVARQGEWFLCLCVQNNNILESQRASPILHFLFKVTHGDGHSVRLLGASDSQ